MVRAHLGEIRVMVGKLLWAGFKSQTIAFLTGHSVARYVRSLAPLTPLSCSATLRFATLASLTHFACGMVEVHEYVFALLARSMG